MIATYEENLLKSQNKAKELLREIEERKLIKIGVTESAITKEIYNIALEVFGTKKHWHKRLVRTGPNAVLSYKAEPPDRAVEENDLVYVDLGPVFDEFEGDIGKTYLMGTDPKKEKLIRDLEIIFAEAKEFYLKQPEMSGAQLWAKVEELTEKAGWLCGNSSAGHIIGEFSHSQRYGSLPHHKINALNNVSMTAPDIDGRVHHWILEIHLVDQEKQYGGFFEDLLTLD
jgi:Xaa-Pro dipeptidase